MTMIVEWVDARKSIICTTSEGSWTWDDYYQAVDKVIHMADSVGHRVDLINVASETSISPKGSGMRHYQRATERLPANISLMVMVHRSTLVKIVFSMYSRLTQHQAQHKVTFAAAASIDEALRLIEENRQLAKSEDTHHP